MLAEHLHHPAVRCQMIVCRDRFGEPGSVGPLEDGSQPVRRGFVRSHESEVVGIADDNVPQEGAKDLCRLIKGRPGPADLHRVLAEIRQSQFLKQDTPVRVLIGAHTAPALGRKPSEIRDQRPAGFEQSGPTGSGQRQFDHDGAAAGPAGEPAHQHGAAADPADEPADQHGAAAEQPSHR